MLGWHPAQAYAWCLIHALKPLSVTAKFWRTKAALDCVEA